MFLSYCIGLTFEHIVRIDLMRFGIRMCLGQVPDTEICHRLVQPGEHVRFFPASLTHAAKCMSTFFSPRAKKCSVERSVPLKPPYLCCVF